MAFIPIAPVSEIVEKRKTRNDKGTERVTDKKKLRVKVIPDTDFMVWDGEGMTLNGKHEYVYMAAFDGSNYYTRTNVLKGLGTEEILRFMLNVAKRFPRMIHVIFAGSYDANMILKDLDRKALEELNAKEETVWNDWKISYRPRKFFRIVKGHKSMTLWDVWGFFQGSFVNAAKSWVTDDEALKIIELGKAARSNFQPEEIDTVAKYCQSELSVFHKMMVAFKASLDALGLYLKRWDGAAAIAAYMLRDHDVRFHTRTYPDNDYRRAVQCAYAGGRIELLQPGDHTETIYHYDINSAYPAAMVNLPSLQWSTFDYCKEDGCHIGNYDLCRVEFDGIADVEDNSLPHLWPFFHRDEMSSISFPAKVKGWYWAPEVLAAQSVFTDKQIKVKEHYHFHWLTDKHIYPFDWVADTYQQRLKYKRKGSVLEKPLKLGMNSLYGKLAQQVGYNPETGKKPRFHQLEWAGWITSYTRSRLFLAAAQAPNHIIAFETDGIYANKPLDLPLSDALGDWDFKTHDRLTYVQSGVYFIDDGEANNGTSRYRGFDKGALDRDTVLAAWRQWDRYVYSNERDENGNPFPSKIPLPLTRFRTLATSLVGQRIDDWRQWITETRELSVVPTGKRVHLTSDCQHLKGSKCRWLPKRYHRTLANQPSDLESQPHPVVWESDDQAKQREAFVAEMIEAQEVDEASEFVA